MHATITPGKKPKQASRNLTQEIEEARDLYRDDLYAIHDLQDEHGRVLIPAKTLSEVVGIDVVAYLLAADNVAGLS